MRRLPTYLRAHTQNRQEDRFLTVCFCLSRDGGIRLKSSADELAKDVVAVRKAPVAEADPFFRRFQEALRGEPIDDRTEIGFDRPSETAGIIAFIDADAAAQG